MERNVTIVADQTANSLLITGDESVFEARYAAARAARHRRLRHVAPARAHPARARRRGERGARTQRGLPRPARAAAPARADPQRAPSRPAGGGRGTTATSSTSRRCSMSAEETPSVSAEPVSNALIVFASRREIERIEAIVTQLDVPEFDRMNEARLIRITGPRDRAASPNACARCSSARWARGSGARGGRGRRRRGRADRPRRRRARSSRSASWRCSCRRRLELAAPTPRVIRLSRLPAARVQPMIRNIFGPIAQRRGESLAVEIDRDSNALVVAASEELHQQIEALARTSTRGPSPGAHGRRRPRRRPRGAADDAAARSADARLRAIDGGLRARADESGGDGADPG
jgi:hypothetical protein